MQTYQFYLYNSDKKGEVKKTARLSITDDNLESAEIKAKQRAMDIYGLSKNIQIASVHVKNGKIWEKI